ncbi:hypothetical protein [Methyloversatilis sp. XJ19-49]|uniref:hypothetical protein n=1 Tax=Methyloversatilis sp. XJ19-49 TaxID=2963429 RepID=UPI00211CBA33|nr:hypothetical protein [Methyloversatilis sp. XJ19-49]MCQ9376850.1 hypothetical protein [Methyloversatilis sp. XJ19-49]
MHDAMPGLNASSSDALKSRLSGLLDELIRHDGFGSLSVEVRLLKRGQKEVIIDCGKQYRYVIDFAAG